jgi:hypothetical protein
MARTRLLHPEQTTDEDVDDLSIHARYVWTFLPCHADREGRLVDKPFTLKNAILPADQVDMDDLLKEIASKGFIERYSVDGRHYIQIRTFAVHQHPHRNETPSSIPPPTTPPNGRTRTVHGPASSRNVASDSAANQPKSNDSRNVPSDSRNVPSPPDHGPSDSGGSGSGSGSGSGDLSPRDRTEDTTEHVAPGTPPVAPIRRFTGFDVQQKFVRTRAVVFPGTLDWSVPTDTAGKISSFAETLTPEVQADVEPTMLLFWRHVEGGDDDWDDSRLADVGFAYGTWRSRFTRLREELHGRSPSTKGRTKARKGEVRYDPI